MSSRVIILEGPDGGGKSTLARYLQDRYGYAVCKTNQPKEGEDLFTSYTGSLVAALNHYRPVVFDRHYLGEAIYGPIMRGEDRLGTRGRRLIERLLVSRGVHLILCLPTWAQLLEAWKAKNGDDYLRNEDQLNKINNAYHREMDRGLPNATVYQWSLEERAEVIASCLFEPLPAYPSFMTGYPGATTLIVGERVNPKAVPWDLPFHHLGNCSDWLLDRLDDAHIPERSLCWANALNRLGEVNPLDQALTACDNLKRVIALGDKATEVCRERFNGTTEVVPLPHPQYWKRFKARQADEYTQMLSNVIISK